MTKEPKQAFINGCNTKNSTRPLNALEIKASTTLSNGMYAVAGYIPLDGISMDVYKNKTMKDLIFMEHGMISSDETDYNMAFTLAEIRCNEMGI
jgi:hypothetical protein